MAASLTNYMVYFTDAVSSIFTKSDILSLSLRADWFKSFYRQPIRYTENQEQKTTWSQRWISIRTLIFLAPNCFCDKGFIHVQFMILGYLYWFVTIHYTVVILLSLLPGSNVYDGYQSVTFLLDFVDLLLGSNVYTWFYWLVARQ